jgi:hypothetical protein
MSQLLQLMAFYTLSFRTCRASNHALLLRVLGVNALWLNPNCMRKHRDSDKDPPTPSRLPSNCSIPSQSPIQNGCSTHVNSRHIIPLSAATSVLLICWGCTAAAAPLLPQLQQLLQDLTLRAVQNVQQHRQAAGCNPDVCACLHDESLRGQGRPGDESVA